MDIACALRGFNPQQPEGNNPIPTAPSVKQYPRSEYLKELRSKSYWEQHSNLTAAEHARIKAQMLGFRILSRSAIR